MNNTSTPTASPLNALPKADSTAVINPESRRAAAWRRELRLFALDLNPGWRIEAQGLTQPDTPLPPHWIESNGSLVRLLQSVCAQAQANGHLPGFAQIAKHLQTHRDVIRALGFGDTAPVTAAWPFLKFVTRFTLEYVRLTARVQVQIVQAEIQWRQQVT